MKNYYEILGIAENASMQEVVSVGKRRLQEYSVEHLFAGKKLGIDYTQEDWNKANNVYAEVIEAYLILKDENKRIQYNHRLRDYRRQVAEQVAQAQARARQNFGTGQEYSRQNSQTSSNQQYTRQRRAPGQHEQKRTQGRYERTQTDNTMKRSQKRHKQKGAFGKMVDSFKDVRRDEKEYPFFERHQDLNQKMRKEFHRNVKSVPGEIVYQMANGTLHVTYEFIHQLRKLSYFNEDSVPKYVFRNRKLAAAALAVALMASMPGGGEDLQAFPTPDTTITQTQDQTDQTAVEDTMGIVYEDPTITMNEYYEVVAGDTLSDISTRTGIKVHDIMELNGIINKELIRIGDKLVLPYIVDREDLQFYTINVPAKGISCRELAKKYNTDEATIKKLNQEAIAYVNTGYVVLTDTAVVPNFVSVEELDMMRQAASGHMMP